MKIASLIAWCCLFMAGFVSQASAAAPLDTVVDCLSRQPVCTSQNFKGSTSDAERKIIAQLNEDDRIVIVMLSVTDFSGTTADLQTLAHNIDDATGNKYIIGLSVDTIVTGYSSLMPPGVAADLMTRAKSVSMSTEETHVTFIQNVHSWLKANPKSIPPLPAGDPKAAPASDEGPSLGVVLSSIAASFVLAGVVVYVTRRRNVARNEPRFTAPRKIRRLLYEVMEARIGIEDAELKAQIEQACLDTDAYFGRKGAFKFRRADIEMFGGHLRDIVGILEVYIRIQNNPRFFPNQTELLKQGRDGIVGYAHVALNAVRDGNLIGLDSFILNTEILNARRNI